VLHHMEDCSSSSESLWSSWFCWPFLLPICVRVRKSIETSSGANFYGIFVLIHVRFKLWQFIAGVLESSAVFQDEKLEISSIYIAQHAFSSDSSYIGKYTDISRWWYKFGITFFYLILWFFSVDGPADSSSKSSSWWFSSVSIISIGTEDYICEISRFSMVVRRAYIFSLCLGINYIG